MAKKNRHVNSEFPLLNDSQISNMTAFTTTGQMNMENRKPFRTKMQKLEAKARAKKDTDGAYRCNVPVSYHTKGNKSRVAEE